jgi:hypothetical protein
MATKRITTKNFIFSISEDNIKDFCSKIDDLTKIDNEVIITVDSNNTLMYTLAGKGKINAFKSHIMESDYLNGSEKLEDKIMFFISDGKKFYKTINHFNDFEEPIKSKIVYNEDNIGEKILIKNSKLKFEVMGAFSNITSINVDDVEKNMDIDKSNFHFTLKKDDFNRIKKMSQIDKENEVYNLVVKDNKVIIGEKTWTLEIDEIDSPNDMLTFPKKYFNTIKIEDDDINVYVFDHFILVMNSTTNLMISTELTV